MEARVSCTCQACLTWRRVGSLLDPTHFDPSFRALAVQLLRHVASELSDQIELKGSRARRSLAGDPAAAKAPPAAGGEAGVSSKDTVKEHIEAKGEVKSEKEDAEREVKKRRRRTRVPSPESGAKEEAVERSPKESSGKKKKEKEKEKKKESSSPSRRSSRRTTSLSRRKARPHTPSRSPPRRTSPSTSRTSRRREEVEEGDLRPPGQWTLTEARGSASGSSSAWSLGRTSKPPEPLEPPRGWSGPIPAGGQKRSKGIKRKERAHDINVHGFDPERKKRREEHRDA